MKAIGYTGVRTLEHPDSFVRYDCESPLAHGHDILVSIAAVSVNPVDTKVRAGITQPQDPARILGWDAAGTVAAVGEDVSLFKPGDTVFYAGDLSRPGSNASHQLVDERLVGRMPGSLSFAQAAALPLTALTAWEALFDRLAIDPRADAGKGILIIGGAGGVGSIAIQLAKKVAGLEVTATASRDQTRQWCQSLGADHVVNHHALMTEELKQLNIPAPDYILCLNSTDHHFPAMVELIAPQGLICSIVGTAQSHPLDLLKAKSAGFVWEFMFTRSMFQTADMIRQHEILNEIARLVDAGEIVSTLKRVVGTLSPENLRDAHRLLETGSTVGKIVLEGFD